MAYALYFNKELGIAITVEVLGHVGNGEKTTYLGMKCKEIKQEKTYKGYDMLSQKEPINMALLNAGKEVRDTIKDNPTIDIIRFLDLVLSPQQIPEVLKGIATTLKVEEKEVIDILSDTEKVVSYGASGYDVYISGRTFRLQGDDFINPKNFIIWYATEFKTTININKIKGMWQMMLNTWMAQSVPASVVEDPLAAPIFDDLIDLLMKNRIYDGFSKQIMTDISKGAPMYILKDNLLYMSSKEYQKLRKAHDVTFAQMREYFESFLKKDKSEVVSVENLSERFWLFDWGKLCDKSAKLKTKQILKSVEE